MRTQGFRLEARPGTAIRITIEVVEAGRGRRMGPRQARRAGHATRAAAATGSRRMTAKEQVLARWPAHAERTLAEVQAQHVNIPPNTVWSAVRQLRLAGALRKRGTKYRVAPGHRRHGRGVREARR